MEEWVTANISRETSILQFDFSAIVKVSKADICYQLSSSRLLEENDVHPLWSTSGYWQITLSKIVPSNYLIAVYLRSVVALPFQILLFQIHG